MDQVFAEAPKKRQTKSLEGLTHKKDFQGVMNSENCQEVKSSDTFQYFKSSTEAHMTGQLLESTEIQPQARSSEGATPEQADFQGVTSSAEAQGMGNPRIESTLEWILSLLETFRKEYFHDPGNMCAFIVTLLFTFYSHTNVTINLSTENPEL
jgi:hypothetical protein